MISSWQKQSDNNSSHIPLVKTCLFWFVLPIIITPLWFAYSNCDHFKMQCFLHQYLFYFFTLPCSLSKSIKSNILWKLHSKNFLRTHLQQVSPLLSENVRNFEFYINYMFQFLVLLLQQYNSSGLKRYKLCKTIKQ